MTTLKEMEDIVLLALDEYSDGYINIQTFEEYGMLTGDAGIVVELDEDVGRSKFYIKIGAM